MAERPICSTDRRKNPADRRTTSRDRRFFYPARIQSRGKTSLPFTRREPDFVPTAKTIRRKEDKAESQKGAVDHGKN